MKKTKNLSSGTRNTLITLLVVAMAAAAAIAVFAAYTKSTRAKRVIAAYDDSDMLFSSNFLVQGETIRNRKPVYVSSEYDDPVTHVTICNYAQGNPTKTYDRDISYNLNAKIVIVRNGERRDATAADLENETIALSFFVNDAKSGEDVLSADKLSCQFTGTLVRTRSDQNYCEVVFSKDLVDNTSGIYLELTAVPVGNYVGLLPIGGLLSPSLAGTSQKLTWEGYFNEAGARNVVGAAQPDEFDGFNYVITGNGKGSCMLRWDSSKVKIGEVFLKDEFETALVPQAEDGSSWVSVTFDVDSDDVSRYDLQFYYADAAVTFVDWNSVKGCVEFEFTES